MGEPRQLLPRLSNGRIKDGGEGLTSQHSTEDPHQPASAAHPDHARAGDVALPPHRYTIRNHVVSALCGAAVLALIGSAILGVSGKTITIGSTPASATPASSTPASASTAPSTTPAATPPAIAKVITRWRTRTVTSSAMAQVSVLDPTGTGAMDHGWQSTIPCVYVPSAGLLLGDAGAAAGAVDETCTLTVVQLQPSAAGQAVILKDNSGHEANFALSAAS